LAITFTERLFDLLKDKEIGWEAAKALGEIVDSDAILTKDNKANVKVIRFIQTNTAADRDQSKVLYVQKYVSTILPKLVALARTGGSGCSVIPAILHQPNTTTDGTEQTASLVALISVIKACPRTTYANEMPSVCFMNLWKDIPEYRLIL
jgi:DNA repair/transcription protein MET18/MMS19